MKLLLDSAGDLDLDRDVLLIAAYAHDWGYSVIYDRSKTTGVRDGVGLHKDHAILSEEKLEILLTNSAFDFMSTEQEARALHLVIIHDQLDKIKDKDERVLVEADTLGGLDIDFVKPTFSSEANEKYMNGVRDKRIPLFLTDYSKKEVERLFRMREEYYKNKENEIDSEVYKASPC